MANCPCSTRWFCCILVGVLVVRSEMPSETVELGKCQVLGHILPDPNKPDIE
jgi:hypothetical protein